MSRTMTLCPECRTIQKASTVCSICGTKVQGPNLLVIVPRKLPANEENDESSDPTTGEDRSDAA